MNVRECKQIVVSFWWHCRCSDTRAASHLVFTCGRIDRDLIHTGVYLNIYTFSVNRRKLKKLTQNFLNTDTHVSLADRVRAARWIDEIFSPILSIFGIWTEPRTEKKNNEKYINAEWETELTEEKPEMSAHAKIYTFRIEIILEHANHTSE